MCLLAICLTLDPLWRLFGIVKPGTRLATELVDSSFFTNRTPEELAPERIAEGPCTAPTPEPPFTIKKTKTVGGTPGFIGRDAHGRTFLFKLDHPDYPELGTSAAIIGNRIFWALGYHVPPVYLVRIEGTGDPYYDDRRATAALFLDDVRGHFHFDWFRYRRELRGLRLVCAWLNDTDRVGANTLVVVTNGRARYYLIDFNSCLGSWQGLPKETWRSWRHQGSIGWAFLQLFTFGLAHPEPDPQLPIVSPAVGRFEADYFDPLAWRPQWHNNAFEHLTATDLSWIASKIKQLDRPRLEQIVSAALLSKPEDAQYLVETLLERRARILETADQHHEETAWTSPSGTNAEKGN